MKTVFLYGGSGTFSDKCEFEWSSPEVGSVHRFILFMAQDAHVPQQTEALAELDRFGFVDVQLVEGKPIAVEVLNEPAMKVFQNHYEGALSEGCSLVWYP